jgi:putative MATE family efflux protein
MQDLTTGPITRQLFKMTGFMLVTMIFQTLYFLIDLYWVGRLGKEAVAAVGLCGNLTFIVLALTQMLAVGTTTLVSHAAGRRDADRARRVFNQSLVIAAVVGATVFAIAMGIREAYARALSADDYTATLAADYLFWFIPAMALQFGIVSMSAALRGTGNFKPGMVVQTATVIMNMVLAPFLIFGWGTGWAMGVAGAAIASLVSILVGTVWLSLYFLPKEGYLRFSAADWRPDFNLWSQLLKVGLPAGAEFALMSVYLFVVYAISRPFGAASQAGFGIGMRILQAGFMPVVALGFAVGPVAGQNFGAGRADRVRETFKSAVVVGASGMLIFAVICRLVPGAMIRFFSSDPNVIAVGSEYLRIVSWSFVGSGIVYVGSSMFQAMGNTVPALISSCVRLAVVAVPAVALARIGGFELRWIWYLSVAAVLLQMTLQLVLLRREFRTRLDTMPVAASAAAVG